MPKKSENGKAVAARLRKIAAKEAEDLRKQKEEEDAYWKDNDKHVLKKQQRKQEREEKQTQLLQKKHDKKILLEQEMWTVEKDCKKTPQKLTRAHIESTVRHVPQLRAKSDLQLSENLNRLTPIVEEARSIDEAIALLTEQPEQLVKNPEKKLKAAYIAFEEARLKQLRVENPSLKHSQLKSLVFKEWQKSAQNPLNIAKLH